MQKARNEQYQIFKEKLLLIFALVGILLIIGTLIYHFSEGWSFIDALYFSTLSLTARGFSDMHPSNWFSVLFSVFYLIIGSAIMIYAVSTLVAFYASFYHERVSKIVTKFKKKEEKPKERWITMKIKN